VFLLQDKIKGEDFIKYFKDMKLYDLGQPYYPNMPIHPADPPFNLYLTRYHEHTIEEYKEVAPEFADSCEIVTTSLHVGTHMDAKCHMSRNGKIFNGIDITKYEQNSGYKKYGIDEAPIIYNRAVLFDVCSYKGMDTLPSNYGITVKDLEGATKDEGVDLNEGDVALIRTGWSKYFKDEPEKYLNEFAGLTSEGARWLAEKKIIMLGIDNLAIGSAGPEVLETHMIFIPDNGIYTVKGIALEELAKDKQYVSQLIVIPLKIIGATASLVRPIALASKR